MALSFGVVLSTALACAMSSQTEIEAGTEATAASVSDGDLQALDTAWRQLADVSVLNLKDSSERDDIRLSALKAWVNLLAAIDAALDLEFGPNEPVDLNVQSPRAADGSSFPGTPDPSQIKDPAQRETYIRARKENRAKLDNSLIQTHVRRADERATKFAEQFIVRCFAPHHSDQVLMSEIVDGVKLTPHQRKRILSLLEIPTH